MAVKASEEAGAGGNLRYYTASIGLIEDQQEYDIQALISSQSNARTEYLGLELLTINKLILEEFGIELLEHNGDFTDIMGGMNAVR